MEALGNEQTVEAESFIAFDFGSFDDVGDNVTMNPEGTVFTVNRTGLYLVDWNINLAPGTTDAVVGIIENDEGASGAASSIGGSFASGTLLNIDTVPFTISLYNYGDEITLQNAPNFEDSAASIRITRFADGPSV